MEFLLPPKSSKHLLDKSVLFSDRSKKTSTDDDDDDEDYKDYDYEPSETDNLLLLMDGNDDDVKVDAVEVGDRYVRMGFILI